jgi:cobyrinic acid a,c-diamide synthase
MRSTPRLVIAGTHSGAGKTSVATALMAAFARRGLRVQPFKIGPDFIDPGFHEAACGRPSHNLDGWMLSRDANLEIFGRACVDADLAVIEGVMGLFDGREAASESGSTAEMGKWLGAPVVLVVDASAMARSVAALVGGFETFDPALDLAGVLLNRVGGQRHVDLLRDAVGQYCRSRSMGALPRNEKIALPSRHLGLVTARESLTEDTLLEMVRWVEKSLDLDALLELARSRSSVAFAPIALTSIPSRNGDARVRIGIARDAAFCFYYRDNLDLLQRYGAELVEFSPIDGGSLPPDLGGLYLGGGYPEVHAERLSGNRTMIEAIRRFAQSGAPVYAECGGFLYLTEAIVNADGRSFPMAGLFPTTTRMGRRLAALGYRQVEPLESALWWKAEDCSRGHEFHYSAIDPMPTGIRRVYRAPAEGYSTNSVMGSYVHLHFRSCPQFAERFVQACRQHTFGN